jgi:hypothetical protein
MDADDRKQLKTLVRAMVNLYGIAPYSKVCETWARHYPVRTPVSDDDLHLLRIEKEYYQRVGSGFVHEVLVYDGNDEYRQLKAVQGDKPYFEPPLDELLRYEDDLYYEKTPQFDALLAFVQSEKLATGLLAEELVDDIQLQCTGEDMEIRQVVAEFDRRGIVFTSELQLREVLDRVMDVSNHSRSWSNRGFRPVDLQSTDKAALRPLPVRPKVGRNDPCPCGSGKKAKYCCGA